MVKFTKYFERVYESKENAYVSVPENALIQIWTKRVSFLRNNFTAELSREEDVLEWLIANKSTGDEEDVIEDVTAKTLNTLIGNVDNLVVLFCK